MPLAQPFRPSCAELSRAAYGRRVFVPMKSGYLMKRASKTRTELSNSLGKIKFLNYVTKRRFFVLTGTSLAYHHDHRNLDDPLHSKARGSGGRTKKGAVSCA